MACPETKSFICADVTIEVTSNNAGVEKIVFKGLQDYKVTMKYWRKGPFPDFAIFLRNFLKFLESPELETAELWIDRDTHNGLFIERDNGELLLWKNKNLGTAPIAWSYSKFVEIRHPGNFLDVLREVEEYVKNISEDDSDLSSSSDDEDLSM